MTAHRLSRRDFLKSAAALSAGLAATQLPMSAALAQGDAVEVEFWDMVWGPTEYIDAAGKLVDQFNQSQTAVKAVYQSTPWNNWYQTFLTAIGSGTAPDISTGAGYQAVQFFDFGAIMPMEDAIAQMKEEGSLDDFMPGLVDRLTYQDQHVALPWGIDIRIPWYRKDLLEAAGITEMPKDWASYSAAAKAATSGDTYGVVMPSSGTVLGTHNLFMWMFNNGSGFFKEDGTLDVMNDGNIEAMEFVADMVKAGAVHPGSAGFADADADRAFVQGAAAIYVRTPGVESREDTQPIIDKVELMSPIESPNGTKGTIFWINNIMMYTQADDPQATTDFLKWYSTNQLPLWTEGHCGQLPTRTSFAAKAYFQDNAYTKKVLDEWIPVGQTTGAKMSSIFPALNEIEGEGVMQTLTQDLLLGKDAKESLQKAADRIKTIVEG